MSHDPNTPSLDTIYELLAHEHRRCVLSCLQKHGSMTLPDLAEETARIENGLPIVKISEEEILRVYSSLWHTHVPKLAAEDVVEYDQERDLVTLGNQAETIEPYLSVAMREEEQ